MRRLLFNSILILFLSACSPRQNSDADYSDPKLIEGNFQDTTIEVFDTVSVNNNESNTPSQTSGNDSKKPGTEMPKPQKDKPSELDSIKKSYPPKK